MPRLSLRSNRDYSADLGLADVVAMCRARPELDASDGRPVDVRTACDTLAAWTGRAEPDVGRPVLWRLFFVALHQPPIPPDTFWRVPPDPAQPLTTPRGINGDETITLHG